MTKDEAYAGYDNCIFAAKEALSNNDPEKAKELSAEARSIWHKSKKNNWGIMPAPIRRLDRVIRDYEFFIKKEAEEMAPKIDEWFEIAEKNSIVKYIGAETKKTSIPEKFEIYDLEILSNYNTERIPVPDFVEKYASKRHREFKDKHFCIYDAHYLNDKDAIQNICNWTIDAIRSNTFPNDISAIEYARLKCEHIDKEYRFLRSFIESSLERVQSAIDAKESSQRRKDIKNEAKSVFMSMSYHFNLNQLFKHGDLLPSDENILSASDEVIMRVSEMSGGVFRDFDDAKEWIAVYRLCKERSFKNINDKLVESLNPNDDNVIRKIKLITGTDQNI